MCKDPALTYLNDLGYNVIRFPRSEIAPLDVLGRQRGGIARLGRLSDLGATASTPSPTIRSGIRTPELEARRSSKLEAEAAVTVLSPYLKALGASPSASACFKRVKSLQFVFTEVFLDEASPAEIGAYLGHCPIDDHNPLWRPYLAGDGELFIITETLKSRKLMVAAESEQQAGAAIDTGALQAAVGGKVGVSGGGRESTLLTFDGAEPLIFGFKCLRLKVAGGKLELLCTPPSAALAFAVPGAAASEPGDAEERLAPPALLGEGLLRLRQRRTPEVEEESPGVAPTMAESAPLPEEDSPASQALEDAALLYLQLVDAALVPRGRVGCRIRGPLTLLGGGRLESPDAAAIDLRIESDEDGVLIYDGCPAGVYELTCDATRYLIHTLRPSDLFVDREPYRLIHSQALGGRS